MTNLVEYQDKLTRLVDQVHSVDVVYCDFTKAFDNVPNFRLVEKLRAHRIDGKVLWWIESWLNESRQRIVLNGVCSGWEEVKSGVLQGSVLRPTLFLIFINDIDRAMEEVIRINLLMKQSLEGWWRMRKIEPSSRVR